MRERKENAKKCEKIQNVKKSEISFRLAQVAYFLDLFAY